MEIAHIIETGKTFMGMLGNFTGTGLTANMTTAHTIAAPVMKGHFPAAPANPNTAVNVTMSAKKTTPVPIAASNHPRAPALPSRHAAENANAFIAKNIIIVINDSISENISTMKRLGRYDT